MVARRTISAGGGLSGVAHRLNRRVSSRFGGSSMAATHGTSSAVHHGRHAKVGLRPGDPLLRCGTSNLKSARLLTGKSRSTSTAIRKSSLDYPELAQRRFNSESDFGLKGIQRARYPLGGGGSSMREFVPRPPPLGNSSLIVHAGAGDESDDFESSGEEQRYSDGVRMRDSQHHCHTSEIDDDLVTSCSSDEHGDETDEDDHDGRESVCGPRPLSVTSSCNGSQDQENGGGDEKQGPQGGAADPLILKAVVVYIGAVPIAGPYRSKQQLIRHALQTLREKRVKAPTVLMEIYHGRLAVISTRGCVISRITSRQVTFVRACARNRQYFAIGTEIHPDSSSETEGTSSSFSNSNNSGSNAPGGAMTWASVAHHTVCHVFAVDPQLHLHSLHYHYAQKFGIRCSRDLATKMCLEFPYISTPLLTALSCMNRLDASSVSGLSGVVPGSPEAMRVRKGYTSTSDSGIGNTRDDALSSPTRRGGPIRSTSFPIAGASSKRFERCSRGSGLSTIDSSTNLSRSDGLSTIDSSTNLSRSGGVEPSMLDGQGSDDCCNSSVASGSITGKDRVRFAEDLVQMFSASGEGDSDWRFNRGNLTNQRAGSRGFSDRSNSSDQSSSSTFSSRPKSASLIGYGNKITGNSHYPMHSWDGTERVNAACYDPEPALTYYTDLATFDESTARCNSARGSRDSQLANQRLTNSTSTVTGNRFQCDWPRIRSTGHTDRGMATTKCARGVSAALNHISEQDLITGKSTSPVQTLIETASLDDLDHLAPPGSSGRGLGVDDPEQADRWSMRAHSYPCDPGLEVPQPDGGSPYSGASCSSVNTSGPHTQNVSRLNVYDAANVSMDLPDDVGSMSSAAPSSGSHPNLSDRDRPIQRGRAGGGSTSSSNAAAGDQRITAAHPHHRDRTGQAGGPGLVETHGVGGSQPNLPAVVGSASSAGGGSLRQQGSRDDGCNARSYVSTSDAENHCIFPGPSNFSGSQPDLTKHRAGVQPSGSYHRRRLPQLQSPSPHPMPLVPGVTSASSHGSRNTFRHKLSRLARADTVGSFKQRQQECQQRLAAWAVDFEALLRDPAGLNAFTEFLKKQFCNESITFWISCENYKVVNESQRHKVGMEIYEHHFANGCLEPVNIDCKAKSQVERAVVQQAFSLDLFASPQLQIFQLMKYDCWPRFMKSEEFREVKDGLEKGIALRECKEPFLKANSNVARTESAKTLSDKDRIADEKKRKFLPGWKGKLQLGRKKKDTSQDDGSAGSTERVGGPAVHSPSGSPSTSRNVMTAPAGVSMAGESKKRGWITKGRQRSMPVDALGIAKSPSSSRRGHASGGSRRESPSPGGGGCMALSPAGPHLSTSATSWPDVVPESQLSGTSTGAGGVSADAGDGVTRQTSQTIVQVTLPSGVKCRLSLDGEGSTVRSWLAGISPQLSLNAEATDVVDADTGKEIDQSLNAQQALKNKSIELRGGVLLRLDLSANDSSLRKEIAVNASVDKTVAQVLRPLLPKYQLSLDEVVLIVVGTHEVVPSLTLASKVDGQLLKVLTQAEFQSWVHSGEPSKRACTETAGLTGAGPGYVTPSPGKSSAKSDSSSSPTQTKRICDSNSAGTPSSTHQEGGSSPGTSSPATKDLSSSSPAPSSHSLQPSPSSGMLKFVRPPSTVATHPRSRLNGSESMGLIRTSPAVPGNGFGGPTKTSPTHSLSTTSTKKYASPPSVPHHPPFVTTLVTSTTSTASQSPQLSLSGATASVSHAPVIAGKNQIGLPSAKSLPPQQARNNGGATAPGMSSHFSPSPQTYSTLSGHPGEAPAHEQSPSHNRCIVVIPEHHQGPLPANSYYPSSSIGVSMAPSSGLPPGGRVTRTTSGGGASDCSRHAHAMPASGAAAGQFGVSSGNTGTDVDSLTNSPTKHPSDNAPSSFSAGAANVSIVSISGEPSGAQEAANWVGYYRENQNEDISVTTGYHYAPGLEKYDSIGPNFVKSVGSSSSSSSDFRYSHSSTPSDSHFSAARFSNSGSSTLATGGIRHDAIELSTRPRLPPPPYPSSLMVSSVSIPHSQQSCSASSTPSTSAPPYRTFVSGTRSSGSGGFSGHLKSSTVESPVDLTVNSSPAASAMIVSALGCAGGRVAPSDQRAYQQFIVGSDKMHQNINLPSAYSGLSPPPGSPALPTGSSPSVAPTSVPPLPPRPGNSIPGSYSHQMQPSSMASMPLATRHYSAISPPTAPGNRPGVFYGIAGVPGAMGEPRPGLGESQGTTVPSSGVTSSSMGSEWQVDYV